MHNYHIYNKWIIYCSFLLIVLLQSIFNFLVKWYFRPSWTMMLLIYWIMLFPKQVNIGTGFVLGLIMDCIFNSVCGIYALSFSIISYLTARKAHFFRHASILQKSFFILFLSSINQIVNLLIKFFITQILYSADIFWIGILDGLTWPIFMYVINKIHRIG